jgi:hypothetical protein
LPVAFYYGQLNFNFDGIACKIDSLEALYISLAFDPESDIVVSNQFSVNLNTVLLGKTKISFVQGSEWFKSCK